MKYRPELPVKPFENLLAARRWVTELAHWYNHEHRHSAIGFVTPAQRHAGLDRGLLEERALVLHGPARKIPSVGQASLASGRMSTSFTSTLKQSNKPRSLNTSKKQPDSLHFRQLP
jgi:hypothetical protein